MNKKIKIKLYKRKYNNNNNKIKPIYQLVHLNNSLKIG